MRLFTELSIKEIESLEKLKGADANEAKKVLANEVTKLCHGQDAATLSAKTAMETFEGFGTSQDLPAFKIHKNKLKSGIPAFELFKLAFDISGGEARRLIKGKGGKGKGEKRQFDADDSWRRKWNGWGKKSRRGW